MTEAAATHPPRIFGITAADADVAAIIRRGPSNWFHVGKWDTLSGSYTPGSWFHGLLYPQRCDVSPDGKLFCYMALHPSRCAYAAFRSGSPSTAEMDYEIHAGGEARPLIAVQWAEWDARGRLLLATIYGDLRIVDVQHDFDVVTEVSLRDLPRNPTPLRQKRPAGSCVV